MLSLCEARSVISSSFLVTIYSLDSISLHLEDILLGARWLPVLTLVAIQAYSAVNFLGFGSAETPELSPHFSPSVVDLALVSLLLDL